MSIYKKKLKKGGGRTGEVGLVIVMGAGSRSAVGDSPPAQGTAGKEGVDPQNLRQRSRISVEFGARHIAGPGDFLSSVSHMKKRVRQTNLTFP